MVCKKFKRCSAMFRDGWPTIARQDGIFGKVTYQRFLGFFSPFLGFNSSPTFLSQQFGLVAGKPFHYVERRWRLRIQIGGSILALGLFGVGCAGASQPLARSLQIHAARRWGLGKCAADAVGSRKNNLDALLG